MDAASIAASGMASALSRFEDGARGMASPDGNLARAAVQVVEAKASFGANAAVLKTADRMMGALLDIIA